MHACVPCVHHHLVESLKKLPIGLHWKKWHIWFGNVGNSWGQPKIIWPYHFVAPTTFDLDEPKCLFWPIPVMDSQRNWHEERTYKFKVHRWHETSRQMFIHFVGEGHGNRSSLRQSAQNKCLLTVKCRCCQSLSEDVSNMAHNMSKGGMMRTPQTWLSGVLIVPLQTGINTLTDYTDQAKIAQTVLVLPCQTEYMRCRWGNHSSVSVFWHVRS